VRQHGKTTMFLTSAGAAEFMKAFDRTPAKNDLFYNLRA
jgi:hypothetical protein